MLNKEFLESSIKSYDAIQLLCVNGVFDSQDERDFKVRLLKRIISEFKITLSEVNGKE